MSADALIATAMTSPSLSSHQQRSVLPLWQKTDTYQGLTSHASAVFERTVREGDPVPVCWNNTSGPPGPVDSRLMKTPTCTPAAQSVIQVAGGMAGGMEGDRRS